MEKVIVIPVDELTSATFTRARGAEAFEALTKRVNGLRDGSVTVLIDISHAKMVSGSFLDELVWRIASQASQSPPRIGFRLGSKEGVSKLERVCSLRRVECVYQSEDSDELRKTRVKRPAHLRFHSYPGSFFEPGPS